MSTTPVEVPLQMTHLGVASGDIWLGSLGAPTQGFVIGETPIIRLALSTSPMWTVADLRINLIR
jgi:hypothetical protein